MSTILQNQEFHTFNEVHLSDDGSIIKIQRPNQWSKTWTFSKKDLQTYLKEYFDASKSPTPNECYKYIVDKKSKTLVASEFAFTYTGPE